jgi:hypothetical protein
VASNESPRDLALTWDFNMKPQPDTPNTDLQGRNSLEHTLSREQEYAGYLVVAGQRTREPCVLADDWHLHTHMYKIFNGKPVDKIQHGYVSLKIQTEKGQSKLVKVTKRQFPGDQRESPSEGISCTRTCSKHKEYHHCPPRGQDCFPISDLLQAHHPGTPQAMCTRGTAHSD